MKKISFHCATPFTGIEFDLTVSNIKVPKRQKKVWCIDHLTKFVDLLTQNYQVKK